MKIHNLMEDIVIKYMNEILSEKSEIKRNEQLETDMVCYALNKLRPMYISSSRGIIHSQNTKRDDIQKDIDIYSVVTEAINVVSKTRRTEDQESKDSENLMSNLGEGSFFNFPNITGRIIDSQTFMPVGNLEVTLCLETGNTKASMFNSRWKNPLKISEEMEGTFTFWPIPVKSEKSGIQRDFQLNLTIKKEGYATLRKYFEVRVVSEDYIKENATATNLFQIDDIYIYPED